MAQTSNAVTEDEEMTIVKVQRPIISFGTHISTVGCLVYAEGKRKMVEQSVPPKVMSALGGDLKGYFNAEWKRGKWSIKNRVADQAW